MDLEAEAEAQAEVQEEPPQFVPPPAGRLLLKISTAAPMGRILCPEECWWYQGFLGVGCESETPQNISEPLLHSNSPLGESVPHPWQDLHDWAVLTTKIEGIYQLPVKLQEAGGPLPELGTAPGTWGGPVRDGARDEAKYVDYKGFG